MTDGQMYDSAIRAIVPNAQFARVGGKIIWDSTQNDGVECPSEAEINAKLVELQAEYDAQAYSRNRQAEYPSIQECVHAILDNTLDALQAKRASVKLKYPKGG